MDLETVAMLGISISVLAVIIILSIKNLSVVCPPDRVAVITGRKRLLPDGRIVGYRTLKGGRTLRIPLLERVAWLDLSAIPLEIAVTHTYPNGNLKVQGIAKRECFK